MILLSPSNYKLYTDTESATPVAATTANRAGPCVSWCAGSNKPWDMKCQWKTSCAGCPQCNGVWFWCSTGDIGNVFAKCQIDLLSLSTTIRSLYRSQLTLSPANASTRSRTSRSTISFVHCALALQAQTVLRNQMQDWKVRTRWKYTGRDSWQILSTLFCMWKA